VALSEVSLGVTFGVVHGHFSTFAAELDRVATADPVLTAAREQWRTEVGLYAQARPLPQDACSRIRRWRLDGYPSDRLPVLQPEPLHDILVQGLSERQGGSGPNDFLVRDRMVELGVTAGQARRFLGWTLFDGVIPQRTLTIVKRDEET
jgi:hypothetical protein